MISDNNPTYVADLRFALDVMEESSHLGLDPQYATMLRSVIRGQIAMAEKRSIGAVPTDSTDILVSA